MFAILENYPWPGNARELKNTVERMAILTPSDRIPEEAVPLEIRVTPGGSPAASLQDTRDSAERASIIKALDQTSWNVSGAARLLGIERTNLHKRIRALGITREI